MVTCKVCKRDHDPSEGAFCPYCGAQTADELTPAVRGLRLLAQAAAQQEQDQKTEAALRASADAAGVPPLLAFFAAQVLGPADVRRGAAYGLALEIHKLARNAIKDLPSAPSTDPKRSRKKGGRRAS